MITRLNIGGPSIQATRLTSALEAHGFRTRLVHGRLGTGEGDMSYLIPAGADVAFIPSLARPVSPLSDLKALVALYRLLKDLRPSIVHTHMAKAGMLGRLAAAWYNLTRGPAPRARIVHTYHGHVLEGYFSPLISAVYLTIERALARISDAIIAISPALRDELHQTYRIGTAAKYRVVRLGFDLEPFAAVDERSRSESRERLGIADGTPVICTVGRLTAIKQQSLFLDVAQRVKASHPTVVALIAGDGELRGELEARAKELGIAGDVRFLGWRRDLATIYGASDVFVLTSRNEGTPVALIEAMAAGVPGVSTDVGGVKDVIVSSEVGRLAPFGDAAALATEVIGLIADPSLRHSMGQRARAAVLASFAETRLVSDIAGVYRDLLGGG